MRGIRVNLRLMFFSTWAAYYPFQLNSGPVNYEHDVSSICDKYSNICLIRSNICSSERSIWKKQVF